MAGSGAMSVLAVMLISLSWAPLHVAAMYSSSSPVLMLEPDNFQSKIKAGGVWLVAFTAPWCGHCKSLVPEYEKAAAALKGMAGVAAVDADTHKELGSQYGVKGFPTIKLMYADENGKIKASDYTGGRTAKDMVTFLADKAKSLALKRLGEKAAPSGGGGEKKKPSGGGGGGAADPFYGGTAVFPLSDDNFESMVTGSADLWLIEFYAPWCGHCKSLKPEYIEAAEKLKGKVKLGAVNCDDAKGVCGQYNIKGFPTLKFFGTNKRSPEEYNSPREAAAIVSFCTQKWSSLAPPAEVHELVSSALFEKECIGGGQVSAKHLCIIAFLPDVLDSKASGRKEYIKALKKTADSFKDSNFAYLWAEGGRQSALESGMGVGGFGYPAVVAVFPGTKKYSTLKGAFSVDSLKEWIESTRRGAGLSPVAGGAEALPAVQTTTPWDGKDAVVQEEEEFSLDDIMNE